MTAVATIGTDKGVHLDRGLADRRCRAAIDIRRAAAHNGFRRTLQLQGRVAW